MDAHTSPAVSICYRIDYSFPEVFALHFPLGFLVEQISYRIDSVPLQFFTSGRFR